MENTTSKSGNFYKTAFFLLLAVIFLTVAAYGGFWYGKNMVSKKQESESATPTIKIEKSRLTPTLSIEKGISVTQAPQPTTPDKELITQAFAEKYGKSVGDVSVTINKNDGSYASGGVKFAGEMGGGWFLAAKQGAEWIIVADGNGTVMCSSLEGYDFPVEIAPECYDEVSGNLITR